MTTKKWLGICSPPIVICWLQVLSVLAAANMSSLAVDRPGDLKPLRSTPGFLTCDERLLGCLEGFADFTGCLDGNMNSEGSILDEATAGATLAVLQRSAARQTNSLAPSTS